MAIQKNAASGILSTGSSYGINPRERENQTSDKCIIACSVGVFLLLGVAVSHYQSIWHGWTFDETLARVVADTWGSYSNTLAVHPIATKAATSATVYTIGDIIAQRTEGKDSIEDMDFLRVARSATAGFIGHGPMSHCWYNVCDDFFVNVLHCTAWWSFIPKVVVDQTVWGPIWNSNYLILLGLMKMEKLDTIWTDVKRSTIPLFVSGLKLWPAAHIVTYGLIPIENRLLWVDLVEILWVSILATQAAGLSAEKTPDQDEVVVLTDAKQTL